LVNNCGVGFGKPILDVDLEEARKVYDVNVWGVLAVIQAFAPLVIAAEGTIANTGSVVAHLQSPFIGSFLHVINSCQWTLHIPSRNIRVI
jgi:1-acylglycerone phosphate reductase